MKMATQLSKLRELDGHLHSNSPRPILAKSWCPSVGGQVVCCAAWFLAVTCCKVFFTYVIYVYIYTYTCFVICTCVSTDVCIFNTYIIYIYVYVYVYVYVYAYVYVYVYVLFLSWGLNACG